MCIFSKYKKNCSKWHEWNVCHLQKRFVWRHLEMIQYLSTHNLTSRQTEPISFVKYVRFSVNVVSLHHLIFIIKTYVTVSNRKFLWLKTKPIHVFFCSALGIQFKFQEVEIRYNSIARNCHQLYWVNLVLTQRRVFFLPSFSYCRHASSNRIETRLKHKINITEHRPHW